MYLSQKRKLSQQNVIWNWDPKVDVAITLRFLLALEKKVLGKLWVPWALEKKVLGTPRWPHEFHKFLKRFWRLWNESLSDTYCGLFQNMIIFWKLKKSLESQPAPGGLFYSWCHYRVDVAICLKLSWSMIIFWKFNMSLESQPVPGGLSCNWCHCQVDVAIFLISWSYSGSSMLSPESQPAPGGLSCGWCHCLVDVAMARLWSRDAARAQRRLQNKQPLVPSHKIYNALPPIQKQMQYKYSASANTVQIQHDMGQHLQFLPCLCCSPETWFEFTSNIKQSAWPDFQGPLFTTEGQYLAS